MLSGVTAAARAEAEPVALMSRGEVAVAMMASELSSVDQRSSRRKGVEQGSETTESQE